MTDGNRKADNLSIFADDKSSLGIQARERASKLMFSKAPPRMVTTPNVDSLMRANLLTHSNGIQM